MLNLFQRAGDHAGEHGRDDEDCKEGSAFPQQPAHSLFGVRDRNRREQEGAKQEDRISRNREMQENPDHQPPGQYRPVPNLPLRRHVGSWPSARPTID